MGFWKNINDELTFRGMSRTELAELTGIKADTINKSIARDSDVSAIMALTICEKLNVPLDEFLGKSKSTEERLKKIESSKDDSAVYEAVRFVSKYSDFLRKIESLDSQDKKILFDLTDLLYSKIQKKQTVLDYTIGANK